MSAPFPHAGEAAALGTAVCWAFSGVWLAEASRRLGSDRLNRLRLAGAVALLGGTMLVLGEAWSLPARQAALLAASGVVGLAMGDAAYFESLVLLGARRAALTTTFVPGVVALLAVPLLGESIGPAAIAGMALTMAGVAWVQAERAAGGAPHPHLARGLLLAAVGALCQAGGLVLAKAGVGSAPAASRMAEWAGLAPRLDPDGAALSGTAVAPLLGTLLRMVVAGVALFGITAARGRMGELRTALRDREGVRVAVLATLAGPYLGVWLSLLAISLGNTAVAATIMAASPVFMLAVLRWGYGDWRRRDQ